MKKNKIKILFITPIFPYPLYVGGGIRIYNYIKNLSLNGNSVGLISFIDSEDERVYLPKLEEFCEKVRVILRKPSFSKDFFNLQPFRQHFSEEMAEVVKAEERNGGWDIIHFECTQMGIYYPYLKGKAKRVLGEQNISFRFYWSNMKNDPFSLSWFKKIIVLGSIFEREISLCKKFDGIFTVSEEDAALLQRYLGKSPPLWVVPNGVDLTMHPLKSYKRDEDILMFLGHLPHRPNTDGILHFYQKIFPLIRRSIPDVRLFIAGREPPKKIQHLAKDPSVTITGFLEDPSEIYEKAKVFIVPITSGSGTRTKVLEAVSRGIPVVSTTFGCEGIKVENDKNILISDVPSEFARHVVELLKDSSLREKLAKRGREMVEKEYDYKILAHRLEQIYLRIIEKLK